jgi:hypothetical protein
VPARRGRRRRDRHDRAAVAALVSADLDDHDLWHRFWPPWSAKLSAAKAVTMKAEGLTRHPARSAASWTCARPPSVHRRRSRDSKLDLEGNFDDS